MSDAPKTIAFVSMTNGHPAITIDRARAMQYAADSRGTVEELVTRTEAEAYATAAYANGRADQAQLNPPLATLDKAPACLNTNDRAMWVLGWNECLAALKGSK